jgi:hypothetical protein
MAAVWAKRLIAGGIDPRFLLDGRTPLEFGRNRPDLERPYCEDFYPEHGRRAQCGPEQDRAEDASDRREVEKPAAHQ